MDINKIISEMTLEKKASYLSGMDFWHTDAVDSAGIPSFMMCDGPNGLRKQLNKGDHLGINESIKTVCYPTASAIAASFDVELAKELGEHLGDECQREKVSMLLGPGLNIKRSPLGGRNFEYYSEDPYVSGEMAAAYVEGLESRHVSSCPKHFAANNQETKRMSGNSNVDERTLHEIYLAGFERMVQKSHPHSLMCAYNQLNGVFCSENKELLTDILRGEWGFDGFVVTDWGAAKDAVKGVKAGLDLVMPGGNDSHKNAILEAVENGKLTEADLDRAVSRILRTLLWSQEGQPANVSVSDDASKKADYAFAKRAAQESAVLLKNNHNTLPLKKEESVAFIGAFAKTPRYQGSGSSHIHSAYVSNALEAAQAAGHTVSYAQGYEIKESAQDPDYLKEAVHLAQKMDKVVIFAGLPDHFESEGFDRKTIDMPENQNRLISEIAKVNKNVVVVLHNGSAVAMPWVCEVSAILEMYLAGDAGGEATVSLLYGDANPSGKLAETFPECIEHTPAYLNFPGENGSPEYREGIFVGYRYYEATKTKVLFPFGHGLSYTSFAYSDMELSASEIQDTDTLTVTATIKNTGTLSGSEVVQLYVRDVRSTAIRPYKELKGFQKIRLAPGESRTVSFTLDKRSFAYYEKKIHDFYVESGDFEILIGTSSDRILLSGTIHVQSTEEIPVVFDSNSTIGDIMATAKGRAVLSPLMQQRAGRDTENLDALGEGSQEMAAAMAAEMPLSSLVSLAGVPTSVVQQLLTALNQ